MVEFASPAFLILALSVPPLTWWWFRRPRAAVVYSDIRLLKGSPARGRRLARATGAVARAFALLLLIAGLAGIRWPNRSARLVTEGVAIELVVDVSGSMAERDFTWQGKPVSRLDAVKEVLSLFVAGGTGPGGEPLAGRAGDPIGLVTFATWPESRCPLTLSHQALLQLLQAEEPRTVPTEQTTNIGDAIAWGLHRLDAARAGRKVMVLVSDGEHNEPPPALKPRQAGQLAANVGIPIYTIDTGGSVPKAAALHGAEKGSPGDGSRTLQAIARLTGGQSFRAYDAAALLSVCREIDRLERAPVASHEYSRYHEGFAWFGAVSLVLWVGIAACERTLWLSAP